MDEKRLINIILLLFSNNLEMVVDVPNQWKNRFAPCMHYLTLGQMTVFELTYDEANWLVEDQIVELDSGEKDTELEYRQYVYRMTSNTRMRIKQVVREIIKKRKKITASTGEKRTAQ